MIRKYNQIKSWYDQLSSDVQFGFLISLFLGLGFIFLSGPIAYVWGLTGLINLVLTLMAIVGTIFIIMGIAFLIVFMDS